MANVKRAKAKYRVRQRVMLRDDEGIYRIRAKIWDANYGLWRGMWRYQMVGEPDRWIPVEKILRPLTKKERGT